MIHIDTVVVLCNVVRVSVISTFSVEGNGLLFFFIFPVRLRPFNLADESRTMYCNTTTGAPQLCTTIILCANSPGSLCTDIITGQLIAVSCVRMAIGTLYIDTRVVRKVCGHLVLVGNDLRPARLLPGAIWRFTVHNTISFVLSAEERNINNSSNIMIQ